MIDSILIHTQYVPASLLPETAADTALIAYKPSMLVTIMLFFSGSAIIYQLGLKRTGNKSDSSVSVPTARPAPVSQPTPSVTPPARMPVYNEVDDDADDEDDDDDDDEWDTEIENAPSADELMASLSEEFDIDDMLREAG